MYQTVSYIARRGSVAPARAGKAGDEPVNRNAPALAAPAREPLAHTRVGEVLRQRELEDHRGLLASLGKWLEGPRDDGAVFGLVVVDLRPAVRCAPGEDELLPRHDLAIDAAGEVCGVLVHDHLLSPRAAHPQIDDDGVGRSRDAIVDEPLKVPGIGLSLEDQVSWRVENPRQGESALQLVCCRHGYLPFACGVLPVFPLAGRSLAARPLAGVFAAGVSAGLLGSVGCVGRSSRSATIVFNCFSSRSKRLSKNTRYGVSHSSALCSGATSSRRGRPCAERLLLTRPAFSSTFRCRDTEGRLIA